MIKSAPFKVIFVFALLYASYYIYSLFAIENGITNKTNADNCALYLSGYGDTDEIENFLKNNSISPDNHPIFNDCIKSLTEKLKLENSLNNRG